MLEHTIGVKIVAERVVRLVTLVPCFGNIYHAQYMWVVILLEKMIDYE